MPYRSHTPCIPRDIHETKKNRPHFQTHTHAHENQNHIYSLTVHPSYSAPFLSGSLFSPLPPLLSPPPPPPPTPTHNPPPPTLPNCFSPPRQPSSSPQCPHSLPHW